jgi:hypothetical protein
MDPIDRRCNMLMEICCSLYRVCYPSITHQWSSTCVVVVRGLSLLESLKRV